MTELDIRQMLLGEYLVKKGLITSQELQAALDEQKIEGHPLGEILVKQNNIEENQLYKILAEKFEVEFVDLYGIQIPKELIDIVPEHIAKTYSVIPVKKEDGVLTVSMINPKDPVALDTIRTATGFKIKPVMSSKTQIIAVIEKHYGGQMSEEILNLIQSEEMEDFYASFKTTENVEEMEQFAGGAPTVKLVNTLIENGIKNRASDVHIEPTKDDCRIRFRVDGVLRDVTTIPRKLYRPVCSRIKIVSNMDIAEKRIPLDGSFYMEVEDKNVDIRVSTYPTIYGEKVVMRLHIREDMFISLSELGFEPEELNAFIELIRKPCGIILVVGPTGSGKTTTLYAALANSNSQEKNIMTIEDPVEFELENISQSQINVKAGFSFAASLRSMMRQDPDVIFVGEIRDLETAQLAIRAALTGHLVFSTLHTNDAAGAVTRLMDMGIEPYLIASSLIGVLAQRLVRVTCPRCRESIVVPATITKKFTEEIKGATKTDKLFSKGKGCDYCSNTGYRGRLGIYELLQITDDKMKDMISAGFRKASLEELAKEHGFRSLKQNGFNKALKGITTLEEVLTVTEFV
jgi:type IV pilus assembly protein PilB